MIQLDLGPGVTTLVGLNGQGKTNLVEAIGYAASLIPLFGVPQTVLSHGQGCYVVDVDGKRYLDLLAGLVDTLDRFDVEITGLYAAKLAADLTQRHRLGLCQLGRVQAGLAGAVEPTPGAGVRAQRGGDVAAGD